MEKLARVMLLLGVAALMGGVVAKGIIAGNILPISPAGWWKVANIALLLSIASGILAQGEKK